MKVLPYKFCVVSWSTKINEYVACSFQRFIPTCGAFLSLSDSLSLLVFLFLCLSLCLSVFCLVSFFFLQQYCQKSFHVKGSVLLKKYVFGGWVCAKRILGGFYTKIREIFTTKRCGCLASLEAYPPPTTVQTTSNLFGICPTRFHRVCVCACACVYAEVWRVSVSVYVCVCLCVRVCMFYVCVRSDGCIFVRMKVCVCVCV